MKGRKHDRETGQGRAAEGHAVNPAALEDQGGVKAQAFETEGLKNDYEITVVLALGLPTKEICRQLQSVYNDDGRAPAGLFEVLENARGKARVRFDRDIFEDLGATGHEDAKTVTREWCIQQLLREFNPREGDGEAVLALGRALSSGAAVCTFFDFDGRELGSATVQEAPAMQWHHIAGTAIQADLSCSGSYVISCRPGSFRLNYRPDGEHHPLGTFPDLASAQREAERHAKEAGGALVSPDNSVTAAPEANEAHLAAETLDTSITVGDRVKSYDYPEVLTFDPKCAELNFVEGVVEAIVHRAGCDRYQIRVDRQVANGRDRADLKQVFPPVNGIPTLMGGVTFGVVKLEERESGSDG